MGILDDFNYLYNNITKEYKLQYKLNCQSVKSQPITLTSIKTYFCCAVSSCNKCVLHNCIPVIIGTWLDKQFRRDDNNYGFAGTFVIDGRHFSFPNIMMNNNVLVHNFFDKQYARDKKMKRMFLYGNFDDDKSINRAIQLVYDKVDDVLYVRDVYAKDYIVDKSINKVLGEYLKCSGKWSEMDFLFQFNNYNEIFEQLKQIMSIDLTYQIDSLSNKIIYKHSYLIQLTLNSVLQRIKNQTNVTPHDASTKKKNTILFAVESKKIYDTIVMGKLIQSVSKTLSKQKKYDQEYNSNNNNLEVFPLQHRIGNEVLRVINENLQQDMLKHTDDYVKFIDSFFHGEMTVAGKKFFLCHNTVLPDVNYKRVAKIFLQLIQLQYFFEKNESELFEQNIESKNIQNKFGSIDDLLVVFNNRPTKYYCNKRYVYNVYYHLKRRRCPIEVKLHDKFLFVNHHEGMVMLKRTVCIDNTIHIHTLQTAYEYHNKNSLLNNDSVLVFEENSPIETTTMSLMSTMILNYYKNYLHIFNSIPVAKLIVSLTNLKNGMVVQRRNYTSVPIGNSVVVDDSIYYNDRMFCLWTIVMDNKLKTAEDPYIPHTQLPIEIYHNKIHRVKGKIVHNETNNLQVVCEYKTSDTNNVIQVEGENYLCIFGTLVCTNKINWNHDGKKYKIEYCTSKLWHIYKFYMYFRRVSGQTIRTINSEMSLDEFGNVLVKLELVYSVTDLEGIKICGIHGQKGVLNEAEDLSSYVSEDDPNVHAQICLSPISYLSRQTNFKHVQTKYCVVDGTRYPLILIPYMFFNNTPDNIYKEFIGNNINGYEKLEGTRLDQWSINQSFVGNRLAEGLHCVRNGNNSTACSGQFNVFQSLLHCNNIKITL
uniref:Late expression factor 8 n=1 Tax=Erinnyis ello granulovirus TaxID=307444 RepID=A0A288WJA1_9BBAC|nr:late expression factor 8 [Erinnyis ello granulovirus]